MKPSWCTPTHGGLSDGTKSKMGSTWFGGSQCEKQNKGVCSHSGLAIYIKKYLNATEELWKPKYFTDAKIQSSKNHQKETKIFQDIITL
jgi:hypothetical protein